MTSAGASIDALATTVSVDPKTVERWIAVGRTPHRSHRRTVAATLAVDEGYLWPSTLTDARSRAASAAELIELHPSRSAVPADMWRRLLAGAAETVDVLMYAGAFLVEQYDLETVVREGTAVGVKYRFLTGAPDSATVHERAAEEDTGESLAARVRLTRRYLRDLADLPGVELRSHETVLYNSLYRFDSDLLVNTHVYGSPAGQSPVLHLRRVPGGRLWEHYMRSFEKVWSGATTTMG